MLTRSISQPRPPVCWTCGRTGHVRRQCWDELGKGKGKGKGQGKGKGEAEEQGERLGKGKGQGKGTQRIREVGQGGRNKSASSKNGKLQWAKSKDW